MLPGGSEAKIIFCKCLLKGREEVKVLPQGKSRVHRRRSQGAHDEGRLPRVGTERFGSPVGEPRRVQEPFLPRCAAPSLKNGFHYRRNSREKEVRDTGYISAGAFKRHLIKYRIEVSHEREDL